MKSFPLPQEELWTLGEIMKPHTLLLNYFQISTTPFCAEFSGVPDSSYFALLY